MAMRYPELRVGGALNSGLIITAALPVHLCPQQNRDQALILTPAQSADLVRQIAALERPVTPPVQKTD
jgi:hypothetical protein